MILQMQFTDDTGFVRTRYEGVDFRLLSPVIQSTGDDYATTCQIALNNDLDRAFFLSLRGPQRINLKLVADAPLNKPPIALPKIADVDCAQGSAVGSYRISVPDAHVPTDVTMFDFYVSSSSTPPDATTTPTAVNQPMLYESTGLAVGAYYAYVRPRDGERVGPWSDACEFPIQSAAPTNVRTQQFTNQVWLLWNNISGVASYEIYVVTDNPAGNVPDHATTPTLAGDLASPWNIISAMTRGEINYVWLRGRYNATRTTRWTPGWIAIFVPR